MEARGTHLFRIHREALPFEAFSGQIDFLPERIRALLKQGEACSEKALFNEEQIHAMAA